LISIPENLGIQASLRGTIDRVKTRQKNVRNDRPF